MDEFEDRLKVIDKEKMKDFLSSLKAPCYESQLLKIAFQDLDIFSSDSLVLYQTHFALYYFLYKLQEEYYKENKYLHIHFMRTFLIDYPDNGKCRFYNEYSGTFCGVDCLKSAEYCDFHYDRVGDLNIDLLSSKHFYLDKDNYYKLDAESAEAFINGTWEILANYGKFKNSFKILELPDTADYATVKRQFKVLAKKHHPDCSKSNDKKFNEINNAYRFLSQVLVLRK